MTCHMILKRFCAINCFSLQVDESTDFTNKSYVVAFVRFVNDSEIHEDFLLQRAPQNKRRARYI
jgi:hypothetical protein